MTYPPQPAFPAGQPYGPHHPYWGPHPPSRVMAGVAALVYGGCAVLSMIIATAGWVLDTSGGGITTTGPFAPKNPDLIVATIGLRFAPEVVLGWPAPRLITAVLAGAVLLLAILLAAGFDFARWTLAVLAGLVVAYYIYMLIYLLTHGGGEASAMVIVAFLVWLAALVLTVLPPVSRGMISYRRKFAGHPSPPQYPSAPMGPYGSR